MRIVLMLFGIILLLYFFYSRIESQNNFIKIILKIAIVVLSIIMIVILLSAFMGHSI